MATYRFRICFEDDEEIVRIIEIKSNQTLEDLHFAILQAIEFDTKHNAVFYLSDDYWKKGKRYTHQALNEKDESPLFSATKLSAMIYDPHQKLLYIYDLSHEWTFMVELVGINIKEDPKVSYPVCVRKDGKPPKQYVVQRKIGPDLEEDEFDYLTKNLLGGEIAEEMLSEHIDIGDVPDDALEEGEAAEETDTEDEEVAIEDDDDSADSDPDVFGETADDELT
jgi:hypothetical protein